MNVIEREKEFQDYLSSIGGLVNGWRETDEPITRLGFFSINAGWYPLVQNLIEELIRLGWNKRIFQVKEKFGGLRFYASDVNSEMSRLISNAENQSYKICEYCGEEGKLRSDLSWNLTLCEEHYQFVKSQS